MWMWNDKETKELFNIVEEFKQKNLPLSKAFVYFANMFNRKPNSVRNYYYKTIKELSFNKEKRLSLNINIDSHNPLKVKTFSDTETKELSIKVKDLLNKGYSVRSACCTLANGNVKEMLRLQNKYRNVEKEEKCKVVTMSPKKKLLTDSEINSLFMGLVRLIKKSAVEQAEDKIFAEFEDANASLRSVMVELVRKQKELEILKKNFEILKNEKLLIKEELNKLRSDKAKDLSHKIKGEKLSSLKAFVEKVDQQKKIKKSN